VRERIVQRNVRPISQRHVHRHLSSRVSRPVSEAERETRGKGREVAGVMEARIPISAKPRVVLLCRLVRAAFSESLKDDETHRRLPRPECRRGGGSGKADRQRIPFLLCLDLFFDRACAHENNCVGRGDTRHVRILRALRMKVQLNRKLLPKETVVNRAIKYCAMRKDPIFQTISVNTFRAESFLLFIQIS